jgi:hypothetical protein
MENLKKILFATIDYHTKGVDTYYNGGSMWLIFTDRKKWVIELTKDGTLWYNHYFFNDCFKYLSLDAVENQHYITKWVEDIIQNGLINTFGVDVDLNHLVEDTIQNGVKETDFHAGNLLYDVEDTIQNGVKHTEPGGYLGSIEMKGKIVHQLESPKQNEEVEDVIENGIKEIKELPDQSGELRGYGDYYHRQEDRTYPHTKTVNDVICDGVKKINWRKVDSHPTYLDRIIKF